MTACVGTEKHLMPGQPGGPGAQGVLSYIGMRHTRWRTAGPLICELHSAFRVIKC